MFHKIIVLYVFMFYSCFANAAKEIEIKISIGADQYPLIENWLKNNAQYMGESKQKEWYVTNPNDPWDYTFGFKDTLKTMRVRQEEKGDTFCYKYRHIDPVTKKTTHRDEYETIVNGIVMLEILTLIGYTEQTIVQKKRKTYLIPDKFEVVFDDVKGLGSFIEIELKESIEDVKHGIAKIEDLLKEMGIWEFKQYDRGYIHMTWNPGYEFGIQRNLAIQ